MAVNAARKPSRATRVAFAAATALILLALCLHAANWIRAGTVDWPSAANMAGLFVLMATGLHDPPRGRLRLALTVLALLLIFPSAWILITR